MSGMNFLEKLLDGAALEWKPLGEVVSFLNRKDLPKEKIVEDGKNYCIHYGELFTHYPAVIKEVKSRTNQSLEMSVLSKPNDVLMPTSDVTPNGLATASCLLDDDVILGGDILVIRGNIIDCRYLSHFIRNNKVRLLQMVRGSTIYHIPCPDNPDRSLAIQAEIVRILDTFTALITALTAALTAELTLRQKQYNYYRDRLLIFEKGEVEWKTLGEVALYFGRGKSKHRPRNDPKLYGGNTPFIQTGDIKNASHIIEIYSQTYTEIGLKQSKLWTISTLRITIPANIAETSILGFDACFPDSVIGFIANPEKTTSGCVEYLLSSLKTKLEEMGQGSVQQNTNVCTFENLKLPFPSLEEQARIVAILDKFDTLTNSIIKAGHRGQWRQSSVSRCTSL